MKAFKLLNFRNGLATNSSSTHSVIYRNENDMFNDLDVFELDYYDRCDRTIAASREAKIKYVLANIMYKDDLVEALLPKYPEMKKYFRKIKKQFEANDSKDWGDNIFGMTCRGSLYTGNLQFDIDYLTEIIENPDIIIVGGSDEEDFVYDTESGHEEIITPDDITNFGESYTSYYQKRDLIKNGTYWVSYGRINLARCVEKYEYDDEETVNIPKRNCTLGKVRFISGDADVVPQYPELIDLRLTNKCNHNCSFCFMDSNMEQPHADPDYVYCIINSLKTKTEFSIGGGNILLYPDLEDVLKAIKSKGHIVNVTINVNDCDVVLKDSKLKRIFDNYVDGIGISVFSSSDVKKIEPFYKKMRSNENKRYNYDIKKYLTIHTIPELIGVDKTLEIIEESRKSNMWLPILYLGYKTNGRGANCESKKFTDDDLEKLFKNHYSVSIDTSFANSYIDWLDKNFAVKKCVTMNEGEYSMYIDGVNELMYKSSYHLDKPYRLARYNANKSVRDNSIDVESVEDAFGKIRKDNGLLCYKEYKKRYFEDIPKRYFEEDESES